MADVRLSPDDVQKEKPPNSLKYIHAARSMRMPCPGGGLVSLEVYIEAQFQAGSADGRSHHVLNSLPCQRRLRLAFAYHELRAVRDGHS